MVQKTLSFLLAVVLLFGLLPTSALANGVSETYDGHWAKEYIGKVIAQGWVSGKDAEDYRPDDRITRAEFVDMVNHMMGYSQTADLSGFLDVSPEDWYYGTFAVAVAAGYIHGDGFGHLHPNGVLTRTEAFVIFARISGLDISANHTEITNGIPDWATSVADWGRGSVAAAIAAGFVNGTDGKIRGVDILNRAEAAALLTRKHENRRSFAFSGRYTPGSAGSIVITGDGVTVELPENAKADSAVIERGVVGSRIILGKGAEVGALHVMPGSDDTGVAMEQGSKIGSAVFDAPAAVSGGGVIRDAKIGAAGVEIETPPTKTTVADGVTATIAGKTVEADENGKSITSDYVPGYRTHTITFESNGGSAVAAITGITPGSKAAAPHAPTKSGYSFIGWYREAALTNVWDFDTDTVNGDITLYAKWGSYVAPTDFTIVAAGVSAGIYVDGVSDFPGVVTAARNLKDDIFAVSTVTPAISEVAFASAELSGKQIIVGTIGKSPVIDQLIADGKLDVTDVAGKWEAFVIQVVDEPIAGVAQALVIAGSDKRGTIYGIYEVSEEIGVSPWHFWADSKPDQKATVVIPYAKHKEGEPTVQFRGIFINDEENLARWASQTYEPGKSMGPKVYETIYELLLRLKANYLWPAMHGCADGFNNHAENGRLADEMGIVIGSTHCDMLLRNNENEWRPWLLSKGHPADNLPPYDYTIKSSAAIMREYWKESILQNKDYEVHWTVGLRDIHDKPLQTSGLNHLTPEEKQAATIDLMEQIFADQYALLEQFAPNNSEYKMFIPYKEVLDLYNAGLEVPDDVTIMWIEDNHGYIRDLPNEQERLRSGGHGIYYHLSYWGPGSQSYMWLNSVPVPQMRSELKKALEHEANKIWILNVGDIKPMEVGMEFFLNYAWDATQWSENANDFLDSWAEREFGTEHAEEIGDILSKYYQIGNTRKPEHLSEGLFDNIYYGDEAQMRMSDFQDIFDRGNAIFEQLPTHKKDAFYEMVLYQIRGAYFLYKEFYYSQKSLDAYEAGKASAVNTYAELAKQARADMRADVVYFNNTLADGKWKPIMGPEVSPPPVVPPQVKGAAELILGQPSLGVLAEGYAAEASGQTLRFSSFTNDTRFIDVFNKGAGSFDYTITADKSWIRIAGNAGTVIDEDRVFVTIDWAAVGDGDTGVITVTADGASKAVNVVVSKPAITVGEKTYVEGNGYVSIEAEHFTSKTDVGGMSWSVIKELGRHSGDMIGAGPSNSVSIPLEDVKTQSPSLEYKVYFTSTGTFEAEIYRFPTLAAKVGQRFAIAIDEEAPILVEGFYDSNAYGLGSIWEIAIFSQIQKMSVKLPVNSVGEHTIKVWMIDGGIVLDKIVIYTEQPLDPAPAPDPNAIVPLPGVAPRPVTYFGPPESYNSTHNASPDSTYPEVARPAPAPQEPNSISPWGEGYFVEENGKIAFEAEVAGENSDYANIVNRKDGGFFVTGGASASEYILRMPDKGVFWTPALTEVPNTAPQLTYSVYVTNPGTYNISVLAMSQDTASDSLYVGANHTTTSAITAGFTHNNWAWVKGVVTLNAGLNTVHIWAREDGTRIDKVYLSRTAEAPPSPLVPSARAVAEDNPLKAALTNVIAEVSARLTSIPLGTDVGDYSQVAYDDLKAGIVAAELLKLSPNLTQGLVDETAADLRALRNVLEGSKNYDSDGVDYRVYEDFNKNTVGEIPFGLTWTTLSGTAGVAVANHPSAENKSLLASTGSGAGNATLNYVLSEPLSGKFAVEGKFCVPSAGSSQWSNALYLYNAAGEIMTGFAFQSGKIRATTTSAAQVDTAATYTPGDWVHIKLVIDTEEQAANGSMGTQTLYVDGVPTAIGASINHLRTPVTNAATGTLSKIMFGPDKTSVTMYIDDLKVYPVVEANPAREGLMSVIAAAMVNVNNIPIGNEVGDYAQAAYDAFMAKIEEAKLLRYSAALDAAKVTEIENELAPLRTALFNAKIYDSNGITYVLYENFNVKATGEIPYGLNAGSQTSAGVKVANKPSASNKSLLVTTGTSLRYELETPLSGTVVVEGRYYVPSASSSTWTNGLYIGSGSLWPTNVGFQSSKIRVNVTTAQSGQRDIANLDIGKWVDLKLVIQTTEYELDGTTVKTPGRVTMYVDGEVVNLNNSASAVAQSERYSDTEFKLRSEAKEITHIMFGGHASATMYIDDLRVYVDNGTVTPPDPDPDDAAVRAALSSAISTASADLAKIPVGTAVGTYSQTAYAALTARIAEAQAMLNSQGVLTQTGIDTIVSALVDLRTAFLGSKNYDSEGMNYAVYENFNYNPTGEAPFDVEVKTKTNATVEVAAEPADNNRSLRITTGAGGGRNAELYYHLKQPLTGIIVLEGRYKVPSAANSSWVNALYVYNAAGGIMYGVGFQSNKIRVANGSGTAGQKDTSATYKPNDPENPDEWVDIKLVIDTTATASNGTTGTATLYVNGVLVKVGPDAASQTYLRTPVTGTEGTAHIAKIRLGGDMDNITMYVDDLKVYQQPETTP